MPTLLRCFLIPLLVLTLALPDRALCQQFGITEKSRAFVNDSDFDSTILSKAVPVAMGRNISYATLKERYPSYRPVFSQLLNSMLQSRYAQLDQQYAETKKGTISYKKARSEYLKEMAAAVDRILQNPEAFNTLFVSDNSDRILSFRSLVMVHTDGSLEVTETIRIYNGNGASAGMDSRNDDIQRGIVRDFPTRYLDSNGLWTTTGFHLKKVLKNGQKEPYLSENLNNGKRIKIGRADLILQPGIYEYQLQYTTRRQFIFHPDKDELYWNVNGNGWVFTADTIDCRVRFPDGAQVLETACYTGAQGSNRSDCRSEVQGTEVLFTGNRRFDAYEGMTVAAAIRKGILQAPGNGELFMDKLRANFWLPLLALISVLFLFYYWRIWQKKGKDPRQGTVYPQFEPPAGLMPADTGYILDQHFGSHLFVASLVDAAVHRDLQIGVDKKGWLIKTPVYSFDKPEPVPSPSPLPSATPHRYGFDISSIYGEKAQRGTYNATLKNLQTKLEQDLSERFQVRTSRKTTTRGLFALNRTYSVIGFIILVAATGGSFLFVTNHYSNTILIFCMVCILFMLITHIVFARIMSAYTQEGRAIADHILGFRMYLETAEQRYFEKLTPPEKTLELFERYLPYAIALKVENEWAEKFDSIIQQALESGYRPAYFYTGSHFGTGFSARDLSSGVSSGLSNTISAASTPPSSSRGGSGGGGFSGGGGGGGGGGGW